MKIITEFPHAVTEHADIEIVMSDGCRLSARVWMPNCAADTPVPVILEHLPYRKRDGTIVRDQFTMPWFAGHGYACIRTDMRGNGDSDGLMEDEYTVQELQDAVEVIAWAAAQSWCNGSVGMMGISWGGFNSLQVAALNPPALKAVISLCSTVDRYADDIHYKGGCLLGENFGWSANMLSYSSRPPDPALVGDRWLDMWKHRLENQPFHLSQWLRHQHRDAFWKHGSVCEDYSAIKAAVLSFGGWHDGYRNTPSHLVENLDAPVKAVVGPWIHKYPHYAGPRPAIGFLQEAKRWWDKWLKDENSGVENDPAYRAYLMDSVAPERWLDERPGRWIAEAEWPSSNVSAHTLHLTSSGLSNAPETLDRNCNSPQDCGAAAGEYFPFAFGDELPDEQSNDDAKSLCFDGLPLTKSLDIVGAPRVNLTVVPEAETGILAVRLCDRRPDGTSTLITFQVLNLTHHLSHEHPKKLIIGKPIEVSLDLDQIAYSVPDGHRLRLAISTAYWPFVWPSVANAGVTVTQGSISLPIRRPSDDTCTFEAPEAATPWQMEPLRPSFYSKDVFHNPETGFAHTKIFSDFGENRDLHHGLISGGWAREHFSIHPDNPLSAKATSEWEATGGREGAMWRTSAAAEMTSSKTHFHFTAKLTAWLNDKVFFERDYSDKIPRDLV